MALGINDPATPAPGTTGVKVSTAEQITAISNSLFGAVQSGAKAYWELRAQQQASRGKPVYVPQDYGGGGSNIPWTSILLAGAGVLGIAYLLRRKGKGKR